MVRESSVTEPSVVMRNMRQVMNGLKNYTGQLPTKSQQSSSRVLFNRLSVLVNCGEGEVALLIQRERENLRPDQFFDVDMVILMLVGNNNVEVYVRMTIAKEMGI